MSPTNTWKAVKELVRGGGVNRQGMNSVTGPVDVAVVTHDVRLIPIIGREVFLSVHCIGFSGMQTDLFFVTWVLGWPRKTTISSLPYFLVCQVRRRTRQANHQVHFVSTTKVLPF